MMKKLLAVCIVFLIYSCEFDPYTKYKYLHGTIPDNPVNFEDLNSEYDDYNSASPIIGRTSPLCFSSSRNSSGANFDIIYKSLDIIMYKENGEYYIGETSQQSGGLENASVTSNLNLALRKINSSYDELGPYLIPKEIKSNWNGNGWSNYQKFIFLFATNKNGNFDIQFTSNLRDSSYSEPQGISFLNSSANDLYPTLLSDSSFIFFCSDRNGNFDIYKTETRINENGSLLSSLSDHSERIIIRDTVLSSEFDDKCPFILGDMMVFSSNREGGFGGFDLYYSKYENGKWSSPVNFGDKINTGSDEYRPIIKPCGEEFTNDMMIFSSNRPGGKGGFDLYYVGIQKNTEQSTY